MEEVFVTTTGETVWDVLQVMMLIFTGLYIIFSVIVLKQVRLMINTLKIGFEPVIELIAIIHLLVAVAVFFIVLIIGPT